MDIRQQVPTETAPDPSPGRAPRAPGRAWAAASVAGAAAAALAFWVMPVDPPPSTVVEGDPALAARTGEAIAGRENHVQAFSVAEATPDGLAVAAAGAAGGEPVGADTPFETGSVFKLFTAMTLADMVEHGEADLDTTLGEVFTDLDFADPDTAGITLEELATHRSGLPTAPAGHETAVLLSGLSALDPFSGLPSVPDSLAVASPSPRRGEWSYSNFGYAALGEALARVDGTPYPELVRERVLDPLGMDDTVIVGADTGPGEAPEGAALPHYEAGSRAQTWDGPAYAPAGVGTWTTTADLVRFAQAVMAGTAPGMSALEPRHDVDGLGRIGLGWYLAELDGGGTRALHDGGTYGSTAFLAVEEERAVVMLSNTRAGVAPQLTSALLDDPSAVEPPSMALGRGTGLAVTLPFLVLPVLLSLALAVGRVTLAGRRPLDRLRLLSMPLGAFAVLLAGLRWGSWATTPPLLWPVAVGLVATAAAVGAWYWTRVPAIRARWRPLRLAAFALSVTASAALVALSVWTLALSNG
ncbi:serine hydrolase domain-containing protein [Actinorugispora endophytica]|uniref:CubicO group peptidase (Beta-lactamase class C family) n=1 Tax=Actinorugispora endophytica TaxID=1605990 RepID=A0A4R6UZA9_9ACTN|nr:serine hydrolase domain-containing protein [Actinorugispora endophytica]TDQ52922.1 CubicO group peptidase (beta-lactamase class C family) [Actinorugispora endophytica]